MSTLALTHDLGIPDACEGVGLLGLPTEESAKRRLSGNADSVVKTISVLLNEMVDGVIENRNAVAFEAAVDEAFPRYVELTLAFGRIVTAIVPRETITRLSSESFCELESDLRDQGVASFGADMRDRAVFTVWTLRKISDLLDTLDKAKLQDNQQAIDAKFARQFMAHALRARFHVDCLMRSMSTRKPLYPEVLPLIADGLRSAVNAYAWVKQSVDLRLPSDESQELPDCSSEDDQFLLDASMQDISQFDAD